MQKFSRAEVIGRADRPDAAVRLAVRLEGTLGRRVDVARVERVRATAPLLLVRAVDEGRVLLDRDGDWPGLRGRAARVASASGPRVACRSASPRPCCSGRRRRVRGEQDNSSIGLILCKDANETVVEYTLRDTAAPIQISEYRARPLPEGLRRQLPSTERIAAQLDGL